MPGAEYDLDPAKIEEQARLIASAPKLAAFAKSLVDWARKSGEEMPNALVDLAHQAQDILTEDPAASLMTIPFISLEGMPHVPLIIHVRISRCLLVLAGFTLLTAIFFWPWVTQLSITLIGPPEDNLRDFWNSWHAANAQGWRDFSSPPKSGTPKARH